MAFRPDGPNVWHDVRRLSAQRRTAGAHAVRSERWIDVRGALGRRNTSGAFVLQQRGAVWWRTLGPLGMPRRRKEAARMAAI